MRLGFVSIEDPRNVRAWSGIPFHFYQELQRQMPSVELIGPLSRSFRYLYAPLKVCLRFRGKSLQLDRHPWALAFYRRQLRKLMRNRQYDALLCLSSIVAAALEPGVPVYFFTDAVFDAMIGYYPGAYSSMSAREIAIGHAQEQAGLDRATVAIYASRWAQRTAEEMYERVAGKIAVAHFGASVQSAPAREAIQARFADRLSGRVNLLFVGVDWERKGGPIAFEATRLLRERGVDAVLHVVGCEAPSSSFVQNHGFVDKSDPQGRAGLDKMFEEAAFFLLPTRAEAAGIVFAEASSFGLPILASDTGGVSDYVVNGVNGYCLPMNATAAEYTDRMHELLASPERYEQMSLAAQDLYVGRLNWEETVRRVLEIVKRGSL